MPDLRTLHDEELMQRLARDDPGALAVLYERYAKPLYGVGLTVYPQGDTRADDFREEVWFRVIHAAGRFDPERASFRTWLRKITTNLAATHVVREARRLANEIPVEELASEDGEAFELPGGPEHDPLRVLESRDREDAVQRAVQALPPNQRAAVVLYYWLDHSYSEIAPMMKTTEVAVKALLHRARLNVKKYLEGEGYGYTD